MKLVSVGEIPPYLPDGHWGMEARKLSPGDPLEMTICVMEPSGGALAHQHDDRPQMLLVVDGTLTITAAEGVPIDVDAGHAAWFLAGEPHAVQNLRETPARYFVVSALRAQPGGPTAS